MPALQHTSYRSCLISIDITIDTYIVKDEESRKGNNRELGYPMPEQCWLSGQSGLQVGEALGRICTWSLRYFICYSHKNSLYVQFLNRDGTAALSSSMRAMG